LWAYFIVQDHAPTTFVHGFCLGCSALFGQCRRNCEYKYRRFSLFREDSLPMASVSPTLSNVGNSTLRLQEEKILADREKRVRQIQQSLRVVQKQIDGHESGTTTVEEGKLLSLRKRVNQYQSEIADFSRQLSDIVSIYATSTVLGSLFFLARSKGLTIRR
jgi:hypothetical protein